ncbi:MAG: hypothetical protein HOE90_21705 [Bacteriovoracaceae bacterium]|jgi:acyl-CoA hydrolase|nr:hypothetical protein [Bacteriovoracaceae bacterium]
MELSSVDECVEKLIQKVGKTLLVGTPLGAGKANHMLNAIYHKAKKDSSIKLTIYTALTLQKPSGSSDLEKRFYGPMVERVFGDYPDLQYEIDRVKGKLPSNIDVIEFYFPPGKFLANKYAQQNYISSNYTHAARDLIDAGVNVLVQQVCKKEVDGRNLFSLSCNPDITMDIVAGMKKRQEQGHPMAFIGQVNQNLPFMYGDAIVKGNEFDFVVDNPDQYYKVFGPPKLSISHADYMIGLYGSTLICDDGELQIGIGSLGDSLAYCLIMRHLNNPLYREILDKLDVERKFSAPIRNLGSLYPFKKGLFAATEMLIDAFMELYKNGILKKKVYDHVMLQRLLNSEKISEHFDKDILQVLHRNKVIHPHLCQSDMEFLKKFGILKTQCALIGDQIELPGGERVKADLTNEEAYLQIIEYGLGDKLQGGAISHGGFFLGPQAFYDFLRELPEEEIKLFLMKPVSKINHLYGHEEIDRLQRKNARFVNTCLMMTLAGSAVSDGLENGKVISGVGGQYNFVSMAQELPDGRSIIQLRSTRADSKGELKSNIVWNYGHITIPRHLRDIVITEYGIANIRGKTDSEIIKRLLNIADSRFQESLLKQAKKEGKIEGNYQIPEKFRSNLPVGYVEVLNHYKKLDHFKTFPFGTDLTDSEIRIGKALKYLKAISKKKNVLIRHLFSAIGLKSIPDKYSPLMERMSYHKKVGLRAKLYRNLLVVALMKTE